ncbi:MAG: leucyl/phenylalanyl-tRNA--protein transferase [Sphingomonadales bacterium]|nr:leucyl/phenylalanyl-tRNA--protein transferase [Sphingomonadales bacterium]
MNDDRNITTQDVLRAYVNGYFPMADSREDDDIFWVEPEERGVFPLDTFHIPKSLVKTIKKEPFTVTVDRAFPAVMKGCASPLKGRDETWINHVIYDLYTQLHKEGFAHSVECWQDDKLVGGLYGISINGAFFGESMFHLKTDASKVALVYLVARLKHGGFKLLDAQFITEHLMRFGAVTMPQEKYLEKLREAVTVTADFYSLAEDVSPTRVLQLITQTS